MSCLCDDSFNTQWFISTNLNLHINFEQFPKFILINKWIIHINTSFCPDSTRAVSHEESGLIRERNYLTSTNFIIYLRSFKIHPIICFSIRYGRLWEGANLKCSLFLIWFIIEWNNSIWRDIKIILDKFPPTLGSLRVSLLIISILYELTFLGICSLLFFELWYWLKKLYF